MARRRDIPRDEILDAAQRLLQQRGCHGFSLREVGEEAGLRAASLHHHFPSRADLLAAVIRRHRDRMNARIAAIEAETDSLPARIDRLRALWLPGGPASPPVDILSAVNSAGETLPPGPAEEARQLTANLLGWFARFAAQAKTDGELPPHTDAEAFAGALLSLLLGAGILGQSAPPGTAARSMAFPLLFS